MKAKALISGGNGFLGKYITQSWVNKGNDVYILSRHLNNQPGCNCLVADITNELDHLDNYSFSTVIHNAGLAHIIPKTGEQKREFNKVNVIGTQHLLNYISKQKEPPQKLIFVSSVAVYGVESGEAIDEDAPLKAISPYAESKILAEDLIREWSLKNGVQYYILRLPLIVGAQPPGNLGAMLSAIERGKYVGIKQNIAKKSFVLAQDVADFSTHLSGPSGCYNLTDGTPATFNAIEQAICTSVDKKIYIQLPKQVLKTVCKAGDVLNRLGIKFPANSSQFNKLVSNLTFSDNKARQLINWNSNSCLSFIENGGLLLQ